DDEADALRFGGVDDLAGEDHFHGATEADEIRQVARAAGFRDEARRDRDLAQLGLVGGVADVAGGGELQADANGGGVYSRGGHTPQRLVRADGAPGSLLW